MQEFHRAGVSIVVTTFGAKGSAALDETGFTLCEAEKTDDVLDSMGAGDTYIAGFLPKICSNYTIIDTKEFALAGIREEYRGTISHLVMHAVNNRVDAYLEYELRHPMTIRRYYRQFDY